MQSSACYPGTNHGQFEFEWPAHWYSPESLYDYIFTQQCDVWSFGVTCWETYLFGKTPWGVLFELYIMQLRFRMHSFTSSISVHLFSLYIWLRFAKWGLPESGSAAHRATRWTPPAAYALSGFGVRADARLRVLQVSERHQWPSDIRADQHSTLPAAHWHLRCFTWIKMTWTFVW